MNYQHKRSVSLVFPGQGSQYVGMGRSLYQSSSAAKAVFDEAQTHLGISPLSFDAKHYQNTVYIQQALLTIEYACYRALLEAVPQLHVHMMAGHSLGEISALLCSSVLSFPAALDLVQQRGQIMQNTKKQGGMLALIGAEASEITPICQRIMNENPGLYLGISAFNSCQQLVLSGDAQAIALAETACQSCADNVVRLSNPLAFHSPLMAEAEQQFGAYVRQQAFAEPSCEVFSNVTGETYGEHGRIKELIVAQVSAPVRWQHIMDSLLAAKHPIIELGPKNTLSRLLQAEDEHARVLATENPVRDIESILNLIGMNQGTQTGDVHPHKTLDVRGFIERTLASTRNDTHHKMEAYQATKACLSYVRGLAAEQCFEEPAQKALSKYFQKALDYKELTTQAKQEYLSTLLCKAGQQTISLLCFAYAGGSSQIYAQWQRYFDMLSEEPTIKVIAVEYPGRGKKSKDALEVDVQALIQTIYTEHSDVFNGAYALFGHSLGGAVAYQLASYLAQQNRRAPEAVFVSSCPTPDEYQNRSLLAVDDQDFLANLKALNGIPQYVYESDDLMSYYLPILKSDITLLSNWKHSAEQTLNFPLHALTGAEDAFADLALVSAWRTYHRGPVHVRSFSGDHFYLHEADDLIPYIKTSLAELGKPVDNMSHRNQAQSKQSLQLASELSHETP